MSLWSPQAAWRWGGGTYRIRTPGVVELIRVTSQPKPILAATLTILSCTDPADHEDLLTRMHRAGRGRLTADRADQIADGLVLAVAGVERWTFVELWRRTRAGGVWSIIDGTLIGGGVQVMDLPPAAATNAVLGVWFRLLTRGDGTAWEKWIDQVTAEPPRAVVREIESMTAADAEAEFAALGAFAAAAAGSTGTTITVQGQPGSAG